jgi:nucleoside-diphosphate kinase
MAYEYTFTMCKRDCIERKLVGKVITRFEERGLDLVDAKWVRPSEEQIRLMYFDKATEPFFPELLDWMTGGPVIAMVWQGEDAIEKARQVIGSKLPLDSEAGSLRGMMAEDKIRSLVHGSRSEVEASNERVIFFPERWEGTPVPARERPASEAPKEVATERAWSWDGASEAEMESAW